jgi:molybdopterin synthase catalytic subunit
VYTLGVVSDGSVAETRERLVAAFAEHGSVALLEGDATDTPDPGATTTYRVGDDGGWRASGSRLDLDSALDRVARSHEYALLTGLPGADVPHLLIGDPDYDGEVLRSVPDPEDVDPEEIRAALEETTPRETLGSLIGRAKRAPEAYRAGAVATFTGRVRERDGPEDAETTHLEFETYDDVAAERMATLESELESREGVFAVRMHHRTGVIESGDDIVFVVVLAGHREEAFATVSEGIDRLKSEVPIFKKEVTVEEAFWRHDP